MTAELMPVPDLDRTDRPEFTTDSGNTFLIAGRFRTSAVVVFPGRDICPQTGLRDAEVIRVGPHGTLYSFSTIHVSATRDIPYTIGYVDFPNGLRVLAPVKGGIAGLKCDMKVELRSDDKGWWVEPSGLDRTEEA